MNISKKAIMSFIVALTSVVSMAQPYYHIMKEENGKLIEETAYNGKKYNIKIDMEKSRPKDAIGGKITVEKDYDCDYTHTKRSFYFTKNGNVYYNKTEDKFYFEKSQLDYPSRYNTDHIGHFSWGRDIDECTKRVTSLGWPDAKETDFYFANPEYLPKLKENLGNEEWAVLSACEWAYVCNYLGEYGWTVNKKTCFFIDTTPGKSLLTELRNKHNGNTSDLSIEEFESYEARGLVCLPASGLIRGSSFYGQNYSGCYWSCSPDSGKAGGVECGVCDMTFRPSEARVYGGPQRSLGYAVRLVILADD